MTYDHFRKTVKGTGI